MMNKINLTDFILQRVYGKNESYTQSEINHLLEIIRNQGVDIFEIVPSLPTSNISPHKLYLVYNNGGSGGNLFDVYLYINDKWEQLDGLSFNISDYYTSGQLDNLLSDKVNLQQYTNTVNSLTNVRDKLTNLYQNLTAFNEVLIGFDEDNTNLGDDLTRLKDNLQGFLDRITILMGALDTVEENVDKLEVWSDNFEVRLDGFVDNLDGFEEDLDGFEGTLLNFDVKLTTLDNGLENTKTVLGDTKSSLQETQGSLTNLTGRVDELDEGLDDLTDNKFPALTESLTSTNSTLSQTNVSLGNLSNKVTGLEGDLNELDEANTDLSNKLQKLKDEDLHDLTESLNTTNNSLSNVTTLANNTQTQLTSLQSTTNTLSTNLNKLKDEDLHDLTESLNTTNQNLSNVTTLANTTQSELTQLQSDTNTLSNNLNKLKDEDLHDLTESLSATNSTLGSVSTLANNTKNELTQLQSDTSTLSTNLQKLKNEDLKNLNDSLTSTNQTLGNVSTLANNTDSALTRLTNQFNVTKNDLTQTNTRLDELWEDLSELGVDVGDLDTKLGSFVHDLGLFSTYLTDFEGDLNDFKNQVDVSDLEYFDSLDNHLLNLFGSIGNLQQSVTGIQGNIDEVQDDIGTVQGELYGVDEDGKPLSADDTPTENSVKGSIKIAQDDISETNQTIDTIQTDVIGTENNPKTGTLRKGLKEANTQISSAQSEIASTNNYITNTVEKSIDEVDGKITDINENVIGSESKEGTLFYGLKEAQDSADDAMDKAEGVENTITNQVNPAINQVNRDIGAVNNIIGEEGTTNTSTLRGAISQAQDSAEASMGKATSVENTIINDVNPAIADVNGEIIAVNNVIGEEGTSNTSTLRGAIKKAQGDATESIGIANDVKDTIIEEVNPAIDEVTTKVDTVHKDIKGNLIFNDNGKSDDYHNWTGLPQCTVSRGAEYTTITHKDNTYLGGYYKNIDVQTQSMDFDVKTSNNSITLIALRKVNDVLVSATTTELGLSANSWYHIRVIIDDKTVLFYVDTVQKLIKTLESTNYTNFILCCGNANNIKVDFKEFNIYDNGLLNQTQIAQNNISEAQEEIEGSLGRIQETEDGIKAVNQLIGEEGTTNTNTIRGAIKDTQTKITTTDNKIGDVNSTDPNTAFGAINNNFDEIKDVQVEMYGADSNGDPLPPTLDSHPEGSVFGGIEKINTDIGSVDDPNSIKGMIGTVDKPDSIKGMIGDVDKPDSLKGIIGTKDSTDSNTIRGSINNFDGVLTEVREYVQGETIFEDKGTNANFRNWTGATQCTVSRGAEYTTITHSNSTSQGGYHQNISRLIQNIEIDVKYNNTSISPVICLRKDNTILNDFTLTELSISANTWVHLNIVLDENLMVIFNNGTVVASEKITDTYNNFQLCCGKANNLTVNFKNMIIRSGGVINNSDIALEGINIVHDDIDVVHDGIKNIGVELYGADSNGNPLPPTAEHPTDSVIGGIDTAITDVNGTITNVNSILYKGDTDGTTTKPADNTVMKDIIDINIINESIRTALDNIFTTKPFFATNVITIYVVNTPIHMLDTQEMNILYYEYNFPIFQVEYICTYYDNNATLYHKNGSNWTYIDEEDYEELFGDKNVIFVCSTLSQAGMDKTWYQGVHPYTFPQWAESLYEIFNDKFYILQQGGG